MSTASTIDASYLADKLPILRAEQCRRKLGEFVKTAWSLVDPAEDFVPGWHIDAIVEHLEAVTRGQIKNLLINVPPRHGKSTIVAIMWPCWEWITNPAGRWLFAAYAESLSRRDTVKSRRLIQSAWYQGNWGHIYQFADDQNEKSRIETTKGGHRIAVGTGGSATGEGGSRLIIDDAHNLQEIESPTVRKGVLDWYDQVWSTRANNPKTTAKVAIMQRGHSDDLSAHILEHGNVEHLCLPAEYEGDKRKTVIGWSDPRTEEGELLWPGQMGPKEIEAKKVELRAFGYAGQFQQRPVPATGGVWKKSWFRFYSRTDLPTHLDMVISSWDCTFKAAKTSDFVCGQLWGRKGSDFYLLDMAYARMDFPATCKAVLDLNARSKYPVGATLIEDKANGSAVLSILRQKISGMIAINPEGGKEARAAAVAPMIEAGNVLLPMPDEAPWVDDALVEFVTFPAAKHDDRVDCCSQALLWLQRRKGKGLFALSTILRDGVEDEDYDGLEMACPHRLVGQTNIRLN